MFFVIVVLAIIGLASLLGATVSTALAGIGALVLIPLVLFKIFLILALFSFVGRAWHRGPGSGRRHHRHYRWERPEPSGPSAEERFEDMHRMAHAKEEVDGWAPQA